MKAIKIFGEMLLYFCIMAVILLVLKKSLGFEHSILPYAGGSTIGWLIWRGNSGKIVILWKGFMARRMRLKTE